MATLHWGFCYLIVYVLCICGRVFILLFIAGGFDVVLCLLICLMIVPFVRCSSFVALAL